MEERGQRKWKGRSCVKKPRMKKGSLRSIFLHVTMVDQKKPLGGLQTVGEECSEYVAEFSDGTNTFLKEIFRVPTENV